MKKRIICIKLLSPAGDLIREETKGLRRQNRNENKLNSGKSIYLTRQPRLESYPQIQARKHTEAGYRAPIFGNQIKKGNRLGKK
jgi:hypothetical protein